MSFLLIQRTGGKFFDMPASKRVDRVPLAEVMAVYAEAKYTMALMPNGDRRFLMGGEGIKIDSYQPLHSLEAGLLAGWMRVHRATLVNPAFVRGMTSEPEKPARYIHLRGQVEETFPVSRREASKVRRFVRGQVAA